MGGLTVSGDLTVPNNANITTLQVNANSFLYGDVYLSRSGDPYGHLIGSNKSHAIVLRGDAIGLGQETYSIERGGYTTFVEWGGVWRFRQIRDTFNNILFEINPIFVNVPTALRVNNVDIRPFIHAFVDNSNGAILATRGIHSITAAKDGTITGQWNMSWTQPHPSGSNYIVELALSENTGFCLSLIHI